MPTWLATTKQRSSGGLSAVQVKLVEAILTQDLNYVQQLLRRGASVSIRDELGNSPLTWAAGTRCPELVAMLVLHETEPKKLLPDLLDAIETCSDEGTREILELFTGRTEEDTQWRALRRLKTKPFLLSAVSDYLQEHFKADANRLLSKQAEQERSENDRYAQAEVDEELSASDTEWSKEGSEPDELEALSPEAPRDWYVVTFSPGIAVMQAPSPRSGVLCGTKPGALIELGEYDESRTWRRCYTDVSFGFTSGWVPVSHPVLGPLVQPREGPELLKRGTHQANFSKFAASKASLALAVQRRDLGMVQQLLRRGASPSFVDHYGETPLFESVTNNDPAATAALLLHGADPCARSSSSGARVEDFTPDNPMKALLAAFAPNAKEDSGLQREALRQALAALPSDVLRPTVWTLRQRGVCTEAEEQAWLMADLARTEGAGPSEGSSWSLRRAAPNAPSSERFSFPPPSADEEPCPHPSASSREPPGMYVVTFRPCIVVWKSPRGGRLCTAGHGDCLQLADWDASGEWRKCLRMVVRGLHKAVDGWILPKHPLLGPLVRRHRSGWELEAPGRPLRVLEASVGGSGAALPSGTLQAEPLRAAAPEESPREPAEEVPPAAHRPPPPAKCAWEAAEAEPSVEQEVCGRDLRLPPEASSMERPAELAAEVQESLREPPLPAKPALESAEEERPTQPAAEVQATAPREPAPLANPALEAAAEEEEEEEEELTADHALSRLESPEAWPPKAPTVAVAEAEGGGAADGPATDGGLLESQPPQAPMAEVAGAESGDEKDQSAVELADAGAENAVLEPPRPKPEIAAEQDAATDAGALADVEAWMEESPLMEAVRKQDLAQVVACLERGMEPNARDVLGETVLFEAVVNGDVEIIAALLVHGADPTLKSKSGLQCIKLVEDIQSNTILDMFMGCEVDPIARDDLLTALGPDMRSAVVQKLGME